MRGSLRLEARQPARLFAALLCGVGTAFFKAASHAALRRRHDSDPWLCLFLRPAGRVAANERYDGNVGGFLFPSLSIVRAISEKRRGSGRSAKCTGTRSYMYYGAHL
jgi:hypothetical protein